MGTIKIMSTSNRINEEKKKKEKELYKEKKAI